MQRPQHRQNTDGEMQKPASEIAAQAVYVKLDQACGIIHSFFVALWITVSHTTEQETSLPNPTP